MKAKEEKNVGVNEEKKVELCAIPREIALKNLQKLIDDNQSVFEQYQTWVTILNSPVNIVSQEETNDKFAE